MRHSIFSTGQRPSVRSPEATVSHLPWAGRSARLLVSAVAIASIVGCASGKALSEKKIGPIGEAELAAKKLQEPLEQHLCKAQIHPAAKPDWKMVRVVSLLGRGPTFVAALEALCREADGQKFPAIVDVYYERAVTAWSPNHSVRGTAVRFSDGFEPPAPPEHSAIAPPPMPKATDEEPLPAGEAPPAAPSPKTTK